LSRSIAHRPDCGVSRKKRVAWVPTRMCGLHRVPAGRVAMRNWTSRAAATSCAEQASETRGSHVKLCVRLVLYFIFRRGGLEQRGWKKPTPAYHIRPSTARGGKVRMRLGDRDRWNQLKIMWAVQAERERARAAHRQMQRRDFKLVDSKAHSAPPCEWS